MDYIGTKIVSLVGNRKKRKDQLRKEIGISGEKENIIFEQTLRYLEENGKLYKDSNGFYRPFSASKYLFGIVKILINGQAVICDSNGKRTKFVIDYGNLNGALDGDHIMYSETLVKRDGHKFANVEKILKRANEKECFKYIGDGFFVSYGKVDNVFFYLKDKECAHLVPGTLVMATIGNDCQIIDYQNFVDVYNYSIVGHMDDPDAQLRALGIKYGFDIAFPKKIEKIVNKLPISVSEEEIKDRVDLRDEVIFTIDGANTKDIDDAISLTYDGHNYVLKVSIADVSHYVKDDNILLYEAFRRGNSAYLANSVFPMFPHKISNGICSLNPDVDRLAKTVEIVFDNDGNVVSSDVYKSVIHSRKKMNYADVNRVLAGENVEGYEEYSDILMCMNDLSKKLSRKQKKNGGLYFGGHEIEVSKNKYDNSVELNLRTPKEAEKIIENFMIRANVEVTKHFSKLGLPFIYRVHGSPNLNKLKATLFVFKEQGLVDANIIDGVLKVLESNNINGNDLRAIFKSLKGKDYYDAACQLLLKTMEKAKYSNVNIKHFGLGEDYYSHFTSPIRRSADLFNHVIIDYIIAARNTLDTDEMEYFIDRGLRYQDDINDLCENFSFQEQQASKAEKEALALKQAQYVLENEDKFEGPVDGVINYIGRQGIWLYIDDVVKAFVSSYDLYEMGYLYEAESKTYHNKSEHVTLKMGTLLSLSDLEVSLETRDVFYHSFENKVKKRSKSLKKKKNK